MLPTIKRLLATGCPQWPDTDRGQMDLARISSDFTGAQPSMPALTITFQIVNHFDNVAPHTFRQEVSSKSFCAAPKDRHP
ncbi:hypothetical protein [Polaromonas sp. C04]|uniref:hypothetical protein n=1 Tax=Polaromonas sp. C04 TaxID=1945857 RepID=UPI001185FC0A|nr:hypothetical protein [Polaromonas sp. C04]